MTEGEKAMFRSLFAVMFQAEWQRKFDQFQRGEKPGSFEEIAMRATEQASLTLLATKSTIPRLREEYDPKYAVMLSEVLA